MKCILTAVALVFASATAIIGFGAPANAVNTPPPPWTLYQTFSLPDACSSAGFAGKAAGQWTDYLCDAIAPATANAPSIPCTSSPEPTVNAGRPVSVDRPAGVNSHRHSRSRASRSICRSSLACTTNVRTVASDPLISITSSVVGS
jgi:hypothetical protein